MIATAALVLALVGIRGAPVYGRAANSARSFHRYFQDLKSADANLNPVERVVFSLILANTEPEPQR